MLGIFLTLFLSVFHVKWALPIILTTHASVLLSAKLGSSEWLAPTSQARVGNAG